MRLIITGLLIIESAFLSTYYPLLVFLVNTIVLTCLLVIQTFLQPYKSAALNILDLSFLLNLTLLYVITLDVQYGTSNDNQLLRNSVSSEDFYLGYERFSSIVALLIFAGIIVYHNIKAVKKTDCYEKLKGKVKNNVPPKVDVEVVELRNFHGGRLERRFSSSFYSHFREFALDL